ncbi:putative aldouronate transport system substrate-binding protein [Paenibacillus sp. V4I3]|uniref:extracellular solute-binding protein n=1 Tax=Paenibacillus sp. V4I3 TaxID=3042305 RepID=UPI0027892219|nr:extracellular solute-binding protein [Paenibacillus sp. V4I3]MDQ0877811.1 putative aldouronate transport system substrate-binding protein [Paenibacillus sp. V4I3]
MKKLKMLTVLSLSGVIALSGCSSSKSGDNSSNTPKESSAATTAQAAPVKATWFSDASFWNAPTPWNTDPKSVEGAITQKTGLTFDFNIPAQDGGTKLSLMLATSDPLPDLITLTDDTLEKKLISSGKVWKLDEFLKKYAPSLPLLTKYPQDLMKAQIKRDGAWYAIPSHVSSPDLVKTYPASSDVRTDGAKYGQNNNVMFNETLMKEAGLTVNDLKTEDGVLAAFEKVKSMKVDGVPVIPLQINGKTWWGGTLPTLQDSFGTMLVDKDGNYRDSYFAPETKHALEFLFKAAKGGYFDPGQMTMDDKAMSTNTMSGRVFCFIGNVANAGLGDPKGTKWVSAGAIHSNQNTKPVHQTFSLVGTGWMQTYVSKTAANPERLAKFLDFMSSDEGQLLWNFGFEGEHYTLKDGLVIKTEKGIQDAKDGPKTGVGMFWPFANGAFNDHVAAPPNADELMSLQITQSMGREAVLFDASDLVWPGDLIPAGSKMANDLAQIDIYKHAQISKMVLAKDEASFNKAYDEMISKLKQMGQTEIDAKYNEQFHKSQQESGRTLKGVNS